MSNVWLKIRIWTKVVTFGAVGLYVLLFVTRNWDSRVDQVAFPMFTTYDKPRLLNVLLITALVSVVGWWLLRTIFRTIRQLKDMRTRGRTARLEKDLADMKAKVSADKPAAAPTKVADEA